MSAIAKKMMEKYGWKEGEGLGKERSGIKSYVKVVRRDPSVATGLGHAADPAQSGSLASTHAVELDTIYGQLHKNRKKKLKKRARSSSSSSDSNSRESEAEFSGDDDPEKNSSISNNRDDGDGVVEKKSKGEIRKAAQKSTRRECAASSDENSSTSSDGGDSEDDDDAQPVDKRYRGESVEDVTRMTDKELFRRCGGVRLGRAGRHRFFDGKLKRIHDAR